jgi:omega-amidase
MQDSAERGAQIVVLPEMWNCPYSNDSFPTYAEDFSSEEAHSLKSMQEVAKRTGILLVGGSIPERDGERLYNTCCVIDADGSLLAKHRCVAGILIHGLPPCFAFRVVCM